MEKQEPEMLRRAILARLEKLSPALLSIREAAAGYLNHKCSRGKTGDEWVAIAHSPWLGVLSHAIRIYPPVTSTTLAAYEKLHNIEIPHSWRPVLVSANGVEAFGLNLFGVLASMASDPPLLTRSVIQCLDISLAQTWKLEYRVDRRYFHVGARDYSDTELVGYFITEKGTIVGIRQNGRRVGEWRSVAEMLNDELKAAEKLFLAGAPANWKQMPN